VTVGILHPGEMGAAVGGALGGRAWWASDGRSPASAERARRAGLRDAGGVGELLARSDVVLSICPPHAALAVAEAAAAAGFAGTYVDANAIAPETAAAVAGTVQDGGATYVDGGIIGAPSAPRLYLSGPAAPPIAQLFAGTAVDARVLEGEPFAASALKMTYAAWTKGGAALLLTALEAARRLGVQDALAAEWERSQPQLPAQARRAADSAATKGWRWVGEMEEIARTLADAGLPDGFHRAAAEVFGAERRAAL
jgi:3-hydroxyisobutyrate dehydrogenase-like beta-hydroxyacid dehydrogenase